MDNNININDVRLIKDFKGISFSEYKKSKVKKELLNSLMQPKIEPACYWCAELVCAGHFQDVWDVILLFVGKYIRGGNPKLPIYIDMRFNNFREILNNGYANDELQLRNNSKIRSLFGEIITVLCFSTKKHAIEKIKLNNDIICDLTQMTNKLKAPSIKYAQTIFKQNDPKELFVALNELIYNIEIKQNVNACFWIEWIIEFETLCNKRKQKCECERRTFSPVQDKYQTDIIWMIWEIVIKRAEKLGNPILIRIQNALLNIFSIRYTPVVKKRRKFLMYFAISLLTDQIDYDISIIQNKEVIETVVSKIDTIYKQVKTNEHKPKTDYLFNNLPKKTNINKTMEKLETVNKILTFGPNIKT